MTELTVEVAILVVGVLLLAGVLATRLSDRLGVPALLLFLGVGMIAGSEGIGGIDFESATAAQAVGTVALLIILYTGGLSTVWSDVRPVLAPGLLLATVGVVSTTLLLGTFAWAVLGDFTRFDFGFSGGITWLQGLLLAAIVSSTDAAAVFSIFRTSDVQPRARIRFLLEFESGSNDPMAILLTTLILGIMNEATSTAGAVAMELTLAFLLGGAVGGLVGWVGVELTNRLPPSIAGLYPVRALAWGLVAFGAADLAGGNGFLAVYAAGLVFGNRMRIYRESIMSFHEGLSWLCQIAMFVVLGLLVFPSKLVPVAGVAVAIALFLMFVARPLSVATCLLPFRTARNELAYVSWVGLRGSVPIVLATYPAVFGIPGADVIFHLVFFIVITSVLLQGLSLVPCARWLGVTESGVKRSSD